ncbi:hypothetical protein AB0C59_31010 [Streptomyces sp. NPDC048664]|uniref:hypothetical protein n=1 Tax=Streptomyces sp. NPDC048664 TaxID=3154505 RepID=UPI00342C0CCF
MTSLYGEPLRRLFVPAPTGTPPPRVPDPPIYRALMRTWADGGRTLPGRHDPEWARLAAPPISVSRGPLDGGR